MELSRGQWLALEQLREIANSSEGALEILDEPEVDENGNFICVRFSLFSKNYRLQTGFAFRNREIFRMKIDPGFPFIRPILHFSDTRFIGHPHVQWGTYICLYQSSEIEWHPSDGMYGFFQRIDEWMTAAGKGTLDPEDAPLHPPIAYTASKTHFVFDRDAPLLNGHGPAWIGYAELNKKRESRFDVVNWVALDDIGSKELPEHIAAAILLYQPLPMEYPDTVYGLYQALEKNGVSFELLYSFLKAFAVCVKNDCPLHIVIGAPMRRKEAGAPLRQHLTVWEVDSSAVNALHEISLGSADKDEALSALISWMATAKALWCPVFENRPEVTHRRDVGSNLASIQGKRILLLGCGALGSVIAEHLVRGGAASLTLVDNGVVKPGLLVRQRYSDRDVGFAKSACLAIGLRGIGLSTELDGKFADLRSGVIDNFDLRNIDLIINATASAAVAHAIERDLRRVCLLIPLISVSVNATANFGSVVVKMPQFDAGTIVIDRLTKIGLIKDNPHHRAIKAFWPDKSVTALFQPEPGCSDPTFVGSSADLAAHAATLLNIGLHRWSGLNPDEASTSLIPGLWMEESSSSALHFTINERGRSLERRHGYEVLTSKIAQAGIDAEIKRIARTRSKEVETGGLIFGEIDEAHGRIYVDSVTPPPPDSTASEEQFLCGTAGTREIAKTKFKQSGGSSRFIGIWHTHPVSQGEPSTDDLKAMVQLLHVQEHPPRQVVMLIIGFSASDPQPNYYLFHRRDIRVVTYDELRHMLEGTHAD